ncbi:putative membrane protein [Terriglobus roseus DSM 18391]|uniref:Putative membrane protein n=1 Tax=Terriglobus roseus (strain DSM 18391 / NRRL B-41598 / KBS 63) TaxID=926566 RepID=I3ZHR2_TERRK|nr:YetF domain-containing protein [Terriglobus roseus]AFL88438.1 putative membrane protein [Terriglobus roseus DSM 18391]AFL88780.1 putative membrane protein [Terriglobus roseus DSM 18391]
MGGKTLVERMLNIHWHDMFVPTFSPLEIVIRGSLIYLALFAFLRIARSRHAGQMGLADILVIVLIADAVSNGMASEYRSIPEGLILAGTIFFWSFVLDWLAYHVPAIRPLIESGPRCLIRHGVLQVNAMRHELLTRDDLMSMLRERGIEGCQNVKRAYIEGDGALSVICYKNDENRPNQPKKARVF